MSNWINWTAPRGRCKPPVTGPVRVRVSDGRVLLLHDAEDLLWQDLGDLLTIVAYRKLWRIERWFTL